MNSSMLSDWIHKLQVRKIRMAKVNISKNEIQWALKVLLDIAEECYPRYYSDDRIAEIDDILKRSEGE